MGMFASNIASTKSCFYELVIYFLGTIGINTFPKEWFNLGSSLHLHVTQTMTINDMQKVMVQFKSSDYM